MRDPHEIDAAIELVRADGRRVGGVQSRWSYQSGVDLAVTVLQWAKGGDESVEFEKRLALMRHALRDYDNLKGGD